jgi:tight adherence protein B
MSTELTIVLEEPLVIGLISSALCAYGVFLVFPKVSISRSSHPKTSAVLSKKDPLKNEMHDRYLHSVLSACLVTICVLWWTKSIVVTTPFTCFAAVISWISIRNREIRNREAVRQVWPEVTDHLISGIHSGLSLSEAMTSLATRGPLLIRPDFLAFKEELIQTGDFGNATENLKERFHSHGSDQILEAILMAKSLGGSELLEIFRTLGDFLRQDLALRKEIEIKHGWIKNSAHLSSAAPWLLLLLLSGQPGTVESFSQPGGVFILGLGLCLTFVAYLWMGRLGRLPQPPRVFAGRQSV